MKSIFKAISRWEGIHIKRKYRINALYFTVKLLILFPLVLAYAIQQLAIKTYNLIVRGRIQRKDNSDIVLSNIVAGFTGLAFPDKKTEVLATKRAEICSTCPSAKESGLYSAIVDRRTTKIQGMKCDECGCNLSAKVRSKNDYCPLGKW